MLYLCTLATRQHGVLACTRPSGVSHTCDECMLTIQFHQVLLDIEVLISIASARVLVLSNEHGPTTQQCLRVCYGISRSLKPQLRVKQSTRKDVFLRSKHLRLDTLDSRSAHIEPPFMSPPILTRDISPSRYSVQSLSICTARIRGQTGIALLSVETQQCLPVLLK